MGRKAGRGEMRCYDVRGCNVRGHNRASTTTKANAAAPEGRSATRSGYHLGRRDANQKNRSDANGKLSHNAQLRCPWCVSRGHTCCLLMRPPLRQQEEYTGRKELGCEAAA